MMTLPYNLPIKSEFSLTPSFFRHVAEYDDWQPISTISRKVYVHDLASYMTSKVEEDGDSYYTRFKYLPKEDKYEPDRVPVFCICEMPFNPDQFMLCCAICEGWFHPSCLDIKFEKSLVKRFVCTNCM